MFFWFKPCFFGSSQVFFGLSHVFWFKMVFLVQNGSSGSKWFLLVQFFLVQNDFYYTTGVSTDTRFNEMWRLDNVAELDDISSFQFQVFPNPSSSEITIKANEQFVSIEILDELGRILFREKINSPYFQLLTSFLESGNYFVKITTENGERIERIIIN
jgi:hypothetical protein